MAAVGAVVRLIEAGVHEKWQAAAEWTHEAEEAAAPQVGCVSALVVDNGGHMQFTGRALNLYWKIEVLSPESRKSYTCG